MEALVFDTTFLIDFQRERKLRPDRAHSFLQANAACLAFLPVTVYGEFAEGFERLDDPNFIQIVDSFEILPITEAIGKMYALVTRNLRSQGNLIGANNLWIAATAFERQLPLVTRNTEYFARVPGLQIRGY